MPYLNEHIIQTLKEARLEKGWSQRELSHRTGIPQSHISKIESGAVDLRVSSLIELARVLELELFLVPKKSIPTVQAVVRSVKGTHADHVQVQPAYHLEGEEDE